MKHLLLAFIIYISLVLHGQALPIKNTVIGNVTALQDGQPLVGVNVLIKGSTSGVITDNNGKFTLECDPNDVLVFSYIGYETLEIPLAGRTLLKIELSEGLQLLSNIEIYATGYQEIPEERATGSFELVEQELLNRSTGTDVLSRLEGVTSGLQFDKRQAGDTYGEDYRSLRIRGVNSIESDNSPLIVVDNFPYEGDISNINPNDVENVTVLKDAAAASIWGARAANGVIVITTKKGHYNQPLSLAFNNNVTIGEKPELHYSKEFLASPNFIEVEQSLFDKGYYTSEENSSSKSPLSPVVELLIKERDGLITTEQLNKELNELRKQDVRDEAENYFYRNSIRQQYALNIKGGSESILYYISGGYDKNLSDIEGNRLQRATLVTNNTLRPVKPLEITVGLNFSHTWSQNNGSGWNTAATRFPYNKFADANGNATPVVNTYRLEYIEKAGNNGLLDWQYRPLQEKSLRNNRSANIEYRINTGFKYSFLNNFNINLNYQYQKAKGQARNLRAAESYYVRNLINRFTQADGTRVFPEGDILSESYTDQTAHAARGQLNYNALINTKHRINALSGMEIRQIHTANSGLEVYGYDDEVLTFTRNLDYTTRYPVRPRGASWIPQPSIPLGDLSDRYISYYGNVSYSYDDKYIVTGSARWDASNLFGVKTNQKGVPLWSVGGSWQISSENFYDFLGVPYLRLRTTYGYNGNINKSVTAYPTVRYYSDYLTDLPTVNLRSPGNPQLRWEKIGIFNVGIDFELRNQRVSGSFDVFNKLGRDIIGESPLDPTSGFIPSVILANKINYAKTQTKGIDVQLSARIIDHDFKWKTDVLFSYISNKILKHYDDAITRNTILSATSLNSSLLPKEGKPIDALYSLPWSGLEPSTGDPQVMIDGQLSKEYLDFIFDISMNDLVYHGVSVPPLFGSIRNTFSWKGISISANISWKTGYYFRRNGLSYSQLFENWIGHDEYRDRWKQPGDENITQVPSMPEISNDFRDIVYTNSELMVEKGDHIRLEDINISYSLNQKAFPKLPLNNLRFFLYARNLGILWRANKLGLDPDYPNATYLPPGSISLGLNATF